jgi:hypothetical protein
MSTRSAAVLIQVCLFVLLTVPASGQEVVFSDGFIGNPFATIEKAVAEAAPGTAVQWGRPDRNWSEERRACIWFEPGTSWFTIWRSRVPVPTASAADSHEQSGRCCRDGYCMDVG